MATKTAGTVSKNDLMTAASEIIDEFYPDRMTLRQVYYQLVSRLVIENKQTAYKRLSAVLVEARETGVVPWDAMEDRTRSISGSPSLNDITDAEDAAWSTINYVKNSSGILADRWMYQDWYVEVWLEKQALEGVFESVTGALEVVLMPGRGYSSATFLKEAAERMENAQAEDKNLAVLYFGDYDPSGMDIERYVEEKMADHGVYINHFSRIALTLDQIQEHDLPPVPAKKTDSRRDAFVAVHGDMAVELDAINIKVLKALIKDAIEEFWDEDAYTRRCDERRARVADYRKRLVAGIKELVEEWEAEEDERDDDDREPQDYECPECGTTTNATLDDDDEFYCSECLDYVTPKV
jgi:hypothetical protein